MFHEKKIDYHRPEDKIPEFHFSLPVTETGNYNEARGTKVAKGGSLVDSSHIFGSEKQDINL